MSVWNQLEGDLARWLHACSSDRLQFRNPNQAIVGFPTDGFRSDGMLTDGRILAALEVEAGQMHPDTNVGKYWLLHREYRQYERMILFHIYTPDFNTYGWRLRLGEFYARQMRNEVPLEYHLLDYRTASVEQYAVVKGELQRNIAAILREAFGTETFMPGDASPARARLALGRKEISRKAAF